MGDVKQGPASSFVYCMDTGLLVVERAAPYCQILRNIEANIFKFKVVTSFWNSTGVSATALPKRRSNSRTHFNTQFCGREAFRDLMVRFIIRKYGPRSITSTDIAPTRYWIREVHYDMRKW